MESTLQKTAFVGAFTTLKTRTIVYWTSTVLFCLQMSFTAYYELLPQGAQAFARLGFSSSYFRVELSLAKMVGVVVLLVPMLPARLKEWAYAGFAINLFSAILAHLSISDRRLAFVASTLTSVLWGLSYFFWRRLQVALSPARLGTVVEAVHERA
jgi:hypothetical protein